MMDNGDDIIERAGAAQAKPAAVLMKTDDGTDHALQEEEFADEPGPNPNDDTVVRSTNHFRRWNARALIIRATIVLVAIVFAALALSFIPREKNNKQEEVFSDNGSNSLGSVAGGDDNLEDAQHPHFKIISPKAGDSNDSFGDSVAIEGNIMVAGAPLEEGASNSMTSERSALQGCVYVYSRSDVEDGEWILEARLTAKDGGFFDHFGDAVAISDGTLIVGSHGSAYIFRRTVADDGSVLWIEEAKLQASDNAEDDEFRRFGFSVAIDGDLAVVGAVNDSPALEEGGSAYIFSCTTNGNASMWKQRAKLLAEDFEELHKVPFGFGGTVAISGETVVVGIYNIDTKETWKVCVYVLAQGSWKPQSVLTEGNGFNDDGGNLAISGDIIVVGVRSDDSSYGDESGSAYIFERFGTEWVAQIKLKAPEGYIQDHFGDSVAISGNTVAIGAHGHDKTGANSGTVYVFAKDGGEWIERGQLSPSDSVNGSFGYQVDISGSTVVASSKERNGNGLACYIFDLL